MQRMPSSAADSETASPTSDPLMEAAKALVERGAFCGLWCDKELIIVSTVGAVPGDAKPGVRVNDALAVLVGLEDEFVALRASSDLKPLRIPNTAVTLHDGTETQRYNISVFWVEAKRQYLVLFSTIIMQPLATDELDQEIRRRRLIEQDLAARSLEYARINQQLEEFAYVISHDLNAPLRALRYLSGDIEDATNFECR